MTGSGLLTEEQHPGTGKISRQSFEEIFARYWEKVFTICLHHTDDEDDAKDLTQEIFLSLWERKDVLIVEEHIEHYLCRAAKYKVLSYARNKGVRREKEPALRHIGESRSVKTPEQLIIGLESELAYEHWINGLPEPGRTYFLSNRTDGLSYVEIAAYSGVSVKTVEYHVSRVLRELRKRLRTFC